MVVVVTMEMPSLRPGGHGGTGRGRTPTAGEGGREKPRGLTRFEGLRSLRLSLPQLNTCPPPKLSAARFGAAEGRERNRGGKWL